MEALFQDSEVFVRERPTKPTEKQTEDFYKSKAQEIIDNNWSGSQINRIIIDLDDLYPFYRSGYELAKKIENLSANYNISVDFIEFLDDLSHDYSKLVNINVIEWVKAIQPMPEWKKGDKIKLIEKLTNCFEYYPDKEFFITGIDEKEARYIINPDKDFQGGTLFNYELLERCAVLL
jgi:hypothetical protein